MTNNSTDAQANGEPTKVSFLNERAQASAPDGIRGLLQFEKPGVVSFRAGYPNPATFPFASITLNLKPPLAPGAPTAETLTIEGDELNDALQYGPSPGLVSIRNWLTDFQARVHKRDKGDFAVTMGSGSQDVMAKAFGSVLDQGDPVIIETPVYAGVLPSLRALDAKMIEIEVDDQGMSPESLENVMSSFAPGIPRPRVVYVNPVGCNPSGCSASRQRKLDILALAKKYNLLIFEDDPYYFLATELIPSYFELEKEFFPEGGHVVRFDSFSKLLSAGARLGYATGPTDIIRAIDRVTSGTNLHTSSISQAVVYSLLKHWGQDGFLAHSIAVAQFYKERREAIEKIAHKHLDGLATWVSPVAGMFLWIDLSPAGIKDSYDLIRTEALAKGVLAVPGFAFYPNGRVSSHVRVSFSVVDLQVEADLGFSRLAAAIKDRQASTGK